MLGAVALAASLGPYSVRNATFVDPELQGNRSDQQIEVLYPGNATAAFPLVVYAHGFNDKGGDHWYMQLGNTLASWGYVVAFPNSCTDGCFRDCKTLRGDPPCFGNYHREQLRAIEFLRDANSSVTALPINRSVVGIAGHSMGGQATLFNAANASAAASHGVRAAVLHHAFTHTFPPSEVPFLVFTGTRDATAKPASAKEIFDTVGGCATRGFANKKGADHHEPSTHFNPKLALYTVAWLKLFVDGTPKSDGMDWDSLVFGNDTSSLCGGGDGVMEECDVRRGSGANRI
jgi:dienelactone hydrolase